MGNSDNKEVVRDCESSFGPKHVLMLCISFAALAAALACLAVSNSRHRNQAVEAEQAFQDSLHVFEPIDFVDSLYSRMVLKKYDDDAPKVVFYYTKDSLGNPTEELVHETHYYENQQKYVEGNIQADKRDGLWYAYYPDGTVQTKGYYVNGKENGRYTVYYSNGNVRYTGMYEEGKQVGEWRFYNEDGSLAKTEVF